MLYLRIADQLEQMIRQDVWKTGEKMPSVRKLSREKDISLSTAFQAYYHLERKGLLEARAKSGYYVKLNTERMPALPSASRPAAKPRQVSINNMVVRVFQHSSMPGMLSLSSAIPDITYMPAARLNKALLQATRSTKAGGLMYEEPLGNSLLRGQLAQRSFESGMPADADDIVITTGCMEALVLTLQAVAKPGDTVAVESPAYFGALQAIERMGMKALELPAHPQTGIHIDRLEAAIQKEKIAAVMVVANFNNPTGSCMPDENKEAMVKLLAKHRIPLIEDDIYGEIYLVGKHRPKPCKAFDTEGLVLYCGSVSKTLAPGFRVGWVVPGIFKEKIIQLKLMHTISSPTVTQQAIGHFLENSRYDNHLQQLRSKLHQNMLQYTACISEAFPAETRISRPTGGLVMWVELPQQVDTLKLYDQAVEKGIVFVPGPMFSAQRRYTNFLRMGYGKPLTPEVQSAIGQVAEMIREML